jgi:hypothetical protein
MGTADDATARIRTLVAHFRERPVTGAEGHSYTPAGRRTPTVVSNAPLDLAMLDHLTASVQEMAHHARQVNPDAGPRPARVEAAYAWYMESTALAPAAEQQRRDTIVYRQYLEHAIAMGDTRVVRPHRCPACRTFGLMWRGEFQAAVCTNRRCLTSDGMSHKWTLAKLAYEHIASTSEISVRDCAT